MSIPESLDLQKKDYVVPACPVCLSRDFRRIYLKGKIPLVKCSQCELHMQQPQPSDVARMRFKTVPSGFNVVAQRPPAAWRVFNISDRSRQRAE
jgi:Zn ribbon nucleic-acid-binding protein